MSDPTPLTPEQMMETEAKVEGYPRRVPQTPCWVDRKPDGSFVALIPVPDGSTAQTRAWEAMCRQHAKTWLRNEPEHIGEIVFVLSPAASSALDAAQKRRERRAERDRKRVL